MIKIIRAVLFVILLSGSISCNLTIKNNQIKDIDLTAGHDTVSYQVFAAGNQRYGFDIMISGTVFIHQPVVPGLPGLLGFRRKADATRVAQLLVTRLRSNNFKFLLQQFETDSLLGPDDKSGPAALKTVNNKGDDILATPRTEHLPIFSGASLPVLPEPPVKNKWSAKGVVPFGRRAGAFGFSIGAIVYMGSGELSDKIIRDFWGYNTLTGAWTCLAELPANCFSSIAFAVLGKGYVALGSELGTSSGKFDKKVYQYNADSNTWATKNDFPGTGRIDAVSFVAGNKVYAGTGFSGQNEKDFYQYDPVGDTWKRVADFGGGPLHAAVGISGGKNGFVVAGNNGADQRFCYEYIVAEDRWERKPDLPGKGRYFLSGCFIDSVLFIAGNGGTDGGQARYRDFFMYNRLTNTWSGAADYPAFKSGSTRAISANVDGKIFMGTGFGAFNMNDWYLYEHYFSVRADTGIYDETVCAPLECKGKWELYQECTNNNCFAGIEIKSAEQLGDFCYQSCLVKGNLELSLREQGANKEFILLPRSFSLATAKKTSGGIGLRLFFTATELADAAAIVAKKTGQQVNLNSIKILQYNTVGDPATTPVPRQLTGVNIITPQLFSYGFNGQTIVADFSTSVLHSRFYLGFLLQ